MDLLWKLWDRLIVVDLKRELEVAGKSPLEVAAAVETEMLMRRLLRRTR